MGIELFTFHQEGKEYSVHKSAHTYEHRQNDKSHRGAYLNTERYKEIILRAMKNGLTSFRGKQAVISFYDYKERPYSLLVALNDDNVIFIITTYRFWKKIPLYKNFIKVHNRINLVDYVLPYMKPEEAKKIINEKRTFEIEKDCKPEDNLFLRAMSYVK